MRACVGSSVLASSATQPRLPAAAVGPFLQLAAAASSEEGRKPKREILEIFQTAISSASEKARAR